MKNVRAKILLPLVTGLLLTGCISSSKTEYVDEPKMAVTFATARAEALFNQGIARNRARLAAAGRPQEKTHVSLIVVNVSRQTVTSGPNRDFNQAVLLCDVDGDRVITEAEAESFLNSAPAVRPPASAGGTAML